MPRVSQQVTAEKEQVALAFFRENPKANAAAAVAVLKKKFGMGLSVGRIYQLRKEATGGKASVAKAPAPGATRRGRGRRRKAAMASPISTPTKRAAAPASSSKDPFVEGLIRTLRQSLEAKDYTDIKIEITARGPLVQVSA